MRKFKKIIGIMLAMVMVFSMSAAAFGTEVGDTSSSNCSITIENSVMGTTYYAYKIFDASYSEESEAVAYTMAVDSAWSSLILGDEGKTYFNAQPVYESGYDANSDYAEEHISYYNITKVETASDTELIAWLTGCITSVDEYTGVASLGNGATIQPAVEGVNGNDGNVVINNLDPGYYFVSTANSNAAVSVTTAAPNATIIDKNQTPGELHKYLVDSSGNQVQADEDGMDETVTFDITAHVPLYDGENVVTEYIFTDTLSNGMLIELTTGQYTTKTTTEGTIYLLTDDMVNEWVTLGDGSENFTDQVFDYTFELVGYDTYTDATTGETYHTFTGFVLTYYTYDTDAYDSDANDPESTFDTSRYPINSDIEIKYSAHVTSLEGYDNTNDIEMNWMVTSWKNPTPEESTPGRDKGYTDHNDVYSWELELVKVDGDNKETPLEGATFTLTSNNMQSVVVGHSYAYVLVTELESAIEGKVTVDGEEYEVVNFETTDYYKLANGNFTIIAPVDAASGTEYDAVEPGPYHRILTDKVTTITESSHIAEGTTDASGKVYFAGLGAGTYVLTEIVSPDGYNLLSSPINFTISWDADNGFTCSMNNTGITTSMSDSYVLTMTVENNQGTELPGTGGMGTKIFYIIGIIIVAGAAILLVTRRRMNRAA